MQDLTGYIGRKLRALVPTKPYKNADSSKRPDLLPSLKLRGSRTVSRHPGSTHAVAETSKSVSPVATKLKGAGNSVDDMSGVNAVDKSQEDSNQNEEADENQAPDQEKGEPIEWTPEMVQAVRESNYITFDVEEETDYTKGPVRMIQATDGVVDCTALLVTLDLSQAIQKSIKAQRDFFKAKAEANDKTAALLRFIPKLDAQIASHRCRIISPDLDEEKKKSLEAELSTLELMVEENKLERTGIHNNLEYKGDMFRKIQARVNPLLEEAWQDALLLAPEAEEESAPVAEYDLQTEFQAFQEKLKDDSPLTEETRPLDTSNDHVMIAMTEGEKEHRAEMQRLQQAVWDAWDHVEQAQQDFYYRDDAREEAMEARRAAIQRGEMHTDADSEAFDVRWHQHERTLTRQLIEAEEAYDKANKAAAEAGALDESTSSDEDDDDDSSSDDGLGEDSGSSWQRAMIAPAPTARIAQWLSDLPPEETFADLNAESASDPSQMDEWDVAELDFGDYVSQIIELEEAASQNHLRTKIDEWQKVQESLRPGM